VVGDAFGYERTLRSFDDIGEVHFSFVGFLEVDECHSDGFAQLVDAFQLLDEAVLLGPDLLAVECEAPDVLLPSGHIGATLVPRDGLGDEHDLGVDDVFSAAFLLVVVLVGLTRVEWQNV